MSGNPYCPHCRDCERACYSCERMFELRRRDTEEGQAALAACPIPRDAHVKRTGDDPRYRGVVVSRYPKRDKKDRMVVVCRVAWERMRNGARRWGGSRVITSDVLASRLEVIE
jgi:hypothetical protein